ncbi:hypothetical protein ACRQ5D_10690 [Mucilaginibacter sp. P25]|uniref:hypothetical protein n=1 Tax=Mucilaginibacter sp. P25 TaxID=3423945 RepID=UPI003D78F7C6
MEYRTNYIKDIEQGEVLANLGQIQNITEYANCWIVTVKTQDDLIMAMKYPKSKILITVHE